MQTLQIKISNTDFQKYNLDRKELKFTDLVDLISREYARQALLEFQDMEIDVGYRH